jgi:hypothetical protein
MKIFLLNPEGVPPNPHLFEVWKPTWERLGCQFVSRIEDAEYCFVDLHTRLADYNQNDLNVLFQSKMPITTWDEFDKGGLSDLDWPDPLTKQQIELFNHLQFENVKNVHFCRLLDKTKTYDNVFPYEKAWMHCEPILTPEQLFDRNYDVCFIANSAPSREAIGRALREEKRLKCIVSLGAEKLPFGDFLNMHKNAKMFVSSAAGGYGDERVQNLFSVAAIIKQRTDQLVLHEFSDGINCLKIDSPPTKEDLDAIVEVVNDKDYLYEVYEEGYNFVKTFYSPEYIAKNIMQTIQKHLV